LDLKQLTDIHKIQCVKSGKAFLKRLEMGVEEFLQLIVTGDETWVQYVYSKNKEQLKVKTMGAQVFPKQAKKIKQTFFI